MAGHTANIINLITGNLRDRYQSGFPILKELIQNADDAKAKRLVFGDHSGFQESGHPLLRGPGLFFFNDGEFNERDKKAIAAFAENSKAGEEGTIGKFGLGMKSVYHLCEAFFYVAYDGKQIIREILNPWNGFDFNLHPTWDLVAEEDWQRLDQVAGDIADDNNSWFFLWIPLRKKDHLKNDRGEATGAIIERFPGDQEGAVNDLAFLKNPSLKSQLAAILPLLQVLKVLEYRPIDTNYSFILSLDKDPTLGNPVLPVVAAGKVNFSKKIPQLVFLGLKNEAPKDSIFYKLKTHSKWPKSFYRDEKGHLRQADDKSKPEGSVLISHQDQEAGRVSIQWTLFLPLEDENHLYEAPVSNSSRNFRIFIHGQFFVDGGRRGIQNFTHLHEAPRESFDNLDETKLQRNWNQELARRVSLPLFLPCLARYVEKWGLEDNEIRALTDAIANANVGQDAGQGNRYFLKTFKQSICAKHSWVRLIEMDGHAWRLIAVGEKTRLLPLPAPPKGDPNRPWVVFPQLKELDGSTFFFDEAAPRISSKLESWSEADLAIVLGCDLHKNFLSGAHLEYFAAFIEKVASIYLNTERLQKLLIQKLNEAYRQVPLSELRRNRLRICKIMDFIEPKYRLALGPQDPSAGTAISENIFRTLWEHNSEFLIIPKDLDGQQKPGEAKPRKADVRHLLQSIHMQISKLALNDPLYEQYLDISKFLLDSLDQVDRANLLQVHHELMVITAFDARIGKTVAASFGMLREAQQRCNLFGFSHGTQSKRTGIAPLLAAVIPEERVFLIRADIFRALFTKEVLPSAMDGEAILYSLGTGQKVLGTEKDRCRLIQQVDNPGKEEAAIRGLRYLLHGSVKHFIDRQSTLWVARHHQSSAWEKLWRQVAKIESQDSWNVLKRNLVENLPQSRWDVLGIREIEPSHVIEEVRRSGAGTIIQEVFTPEEADEILSFVDNRELWRGLPFHLLQSGDRGPIGERAYLDVGLKHVSQNLKKLVTIVVPSDNEEVLQKQRKWVSLLDDVAVIQIALEGPDPGQNWRSIADSISSSNNQKIIGIENLRETPWLPLRTGGYIQPSDVIGLPSIDAQLQQLTPQVSFCYACPSDLDEELLNHPCFPILQSFAFSTREDGIAKLGLLLGDLKGFEIGNIRWRGVALEKTLPVLARLQMLPGWGLLGDVSNEFGYETCREFLLPELVRPIRDDTLVQVLLTLAAEAERKGTGALDAFDLYLDLLKDLGDKGRKLLSKIRLRSKSGQWKFSGELCTGASGVCESFVLDDRHASILYPILINVQSGVEEKSDMQTPAQVELALQAAPGILKDYFEKWTGMVQGELIGGLLSLMGRSLRPLATHYLGGHTLDWLSGLLGWRIPERIDSTGRREWMYGMTAQDALNLLEVAVRIVNENEVTVRNLDGEMLKVSLSGKFSTLIAGAPCWGGGYRVYIPLRRILPHEFQQEDLSDLLRGTAEYLLDKCFNQPLPDLSALWQELGQSDQLEIQVACGKILSHLPFYLRQLNAHHESINLREGLDNYDRVLESIEEAKLSSPQNPDLLKELFSQLDVQRNHLAEIFEKEAPAQRAVLDSLRQKLRDFQYDEQSIPFELFQNADDAAVELGLFEEGDDGDRFIPEPAKKFVVDVGAGSIRFMHWGRLINARGPLAIEGKSQGFHRDLEKMLVLSSSDKPIGTGVTGKFGFGFKSVLLSCDTPLILSGRLRVQIVGGVLPKFWKSAQKAGARLDEFTEDRRYRGTLTELELVEGITPENLLSRFATMAGLLCIFGQAVRRIELVGSMTKTFSWTPTSMGEGIEFGESNLDDESGPFTQTGFTFRLEGGAMFLPLSPRGFVPLPDYVPSIWVTAPTREPESFGFAISAPFALDAGRGRLAGDMAHNLDLATRLGRSLGVKLLLLKEEFGSDWAMAKARLRLAESTTLEGFWASFYRTIGKAVLAPETFGATKLCKAIAQEAIAKVCAGGIPNGLPLPYERFIDRINLKHVLSGPWKRREVLEKLSCVGVRVDQCIDADIATILKTLHPLRCQKLDFANLIKSFSTDHCDPQMSERLEEIARLVWDAQSEKEIEDAHEAFLELRFKSKEGQWVESRLLLCHGIGDKEEKLRVGFAPGSALISDAYGELGQQFFKRCRPRYEAPAEMLVSWIYKADSDVAQKTALEYLVRGELGHKVCRLLRQHGLAGSWLNGISGACPHLAEWEHEEKLELLRLLVENLEFTSNGPSPTVEDEPHYDPYVRGQEALKRIHSWWEDQGRNLYLKRYLQKFYPHGRMPRLSLGEDGAFDRSAWMTILSLGVFQSRGRVTDYQNRSFVERLQYNGWWRVFSEVDPKKQPDEWMRVLEQYAGGQVDDEEFSAWMDSFPRIFRLARWLGEYVELFLSLNRRGPDGIAQLLTPMADSKLQGGGVWAPPINRTLRVGKHLVFRELLRQELVHNSVAAAHAYMPSRAVILLLRELQIGEFEESKCIYQALVQALGEEKATFGGDYDIPLRVLVNHKEAAWDILRVKVEEEMSFLLDNSEFSEAIYV